MPEPRWPQGHLRVAILPFTPFTRKSLISKRLRPTLRTPGAHLLQKRVADGHTQADLAAQLGVSEFTVLNWEQGHTRVIPAEFMPGIISYLGYNPEPRPEAVGAQLRWRRRSLGWTTKEAARRFCVDQETWLTWEAKGDWPAYPRFRDMVRKFLALAQAEVRS